MEFDGVILFCEDIRAQAAFYSDVIGLEPDAEQPFAANRFVKFTMPGGAALNLHSGTKPNGGRQKLTFTCEHVSDLVERLRAAGRRPKKITPPSDPAEIVVFDLRDPEGNRLQVYGPW